MITTKKGLFLLITGALLLTACADMNAKEILRVKMSKPGYLPSYSFARMKKGDKIAIWSDMDFSYTGSRIELDVQVELYLKDSLYETIEFSPTRKSLTLNEVKETEGSRTNWKFSGKNEEIVIKEDGNYKCIAYLKSPKISFRSKKAEIVLKRKK
ncbi:hypothetical protein D3C87_86120 [compost metagenome]